jgi:PKD repeat protein
MSTNNPTSWNWSFSGGTPTSSTTQNPQVVYNSPGTYNVSLTVSNAFGTDTKTKIKYITVLDLPVPVADFTATPTTVYAGETVSFTDMSTNNPTSWNWSFSGGTPTSSTTQNPQVVYNSPGTYNVSLTVSNAFGTDTKTKIKYITVLALPVPVADFTATPTTVYAGETVSFTDMSTNNPTSWNWSFSGGTPTSSTTQNPQVVYNSPGTYNVSLTVSNAFGTDTKTKIKYITVLDLPVPVADFTATPTTVYAGETVNFTDLSTNNPTSWNWSFSGGTPTSSTTQNPQIVYNSPGTYNVSLTVSNAFGTDTKTKTDYIHVSTPSIVNFTADQTIINQGEVVHFSDLSTGNPYFWLWEFQGGTPAINYQQNPTIIFKTPGTFTVKLTVSYANGQASLTREDYITVNELVSLFPPGWDVTLTSTQHVIAVPLDANPRILETPIEPGDFIGVFFTNTFGNLQCGGATMWDGQNNIAIISYGDQSYTPLKDGFSVYEDFKWKVYSYGHQREFDATPVYDVTLPNLGQFFPLGISALIDLSAGLLFNIHIPAGWSGISSPVLPFYPEMDTVLSSIQDNLTILYNFDGIYWPWQNINTLDKWKNSGYTIKMSNTDNLVIGGELIKSLSQTIKSGTGYLPIPTLYDVSTASLFAPFLDKLTLVRNILGTEVFWPQTGINTLPILKPGNAYITHAKSSFIVHFPQSGLKNSYSSPNSDFPELPLVSWSFAVASPDVHMISIPADGFKNLETGDIVGVFTPNNVCAGWAVFENQPLAIPVYGTHETGDEKSGFMANEPFTFRIFRPFNQLYCTAKALFDTTMPDQGIFRSGGISAISSLYPFDESFTNFSEEITVIPNPNNGIFVLSGVSNIEEIVVISQEGQIIKTIENNGTSELNVDISDNRKGIYLIKIIEKQRVYVKKVVIN